MFIFPFNLKREVGAPVILLSHLHSVLNKHFPMFFNLITFVQSVIFFIYCVLIYVHQFTGEAVMMKIKTSPLPGCNSSSPVPAHPRTTNGRDPHKGAVNLVSNSKLFSKGT